MTMTQDDRLPKVVSREEWREARVRLLEKEKAHTRQYDAINRERRELPMVRVEKDYRLEGPDGPVGLLDLFDGQRQLIVMHFMFDPAWEKGCPGCTGGADEISEGLIRHLRHRDTALALVSRAPLAKLQAYQAERGWHHLRWYSSYDSHFNHDFGATLDASVKPVDYNYMSKEEHLARGSALHFMSSDKPEEVPAHSAFLRIGEQVFHTYTTFARGTERLAGSYDLLDITALGRQEQWEEPKGRVAAARESGPFFE